SSATQNGPVTNVHMTGNVGVIGQNAVAADHRIVGNVHIHHKQVIGTYDGGAVVLYGTAVECAGFTKYVVITDDQSRRFAFVFFVLTFFSNTGELEYAVIFSDFGRT